MSRLAGVFAPRREGAPTAERLAQALGAREASARAGPMAVAWTPGTLARTAPALAVAAGSWAGADPALASLAEASLSRLRGRFAVLVWDNAREEGFLAVDPIGAASLFLLDDGSQLTFATELHDLVQIVPRQPPPSAAGVAQWLGDGWLERGDTLLEGVRRLPGGHLLRLRRDGWETVRYWSPRYAEPARADPREHRERVRAEVEAAVARAANRARKPGVLLSGGLDSVTVAAVAARSRPCGAEALRAYSAVFPNHAEVDESALIEAVVAKLGLDAHRVEFGHASMLDAADDYLRTWGLPPASPLLGVHRPLLELVRRDRVDVLLDGQGGDELFGESAYLAADRLRAGRLRSASELARLLAPDDAVRRALVEFGVKGALPHVVHRVLRVRRPERYAPDWLTPHASRLYAERRDPWSWKRSSGPRWWAFLADQLTTQRERSGAHDYLRHKSALAGVEGSHPFLQEVELIELVLSLPPELAFDATFDRPLLRASMEGVVPDEIRLKAEKRYFIAIFLEAMRETDHEAIAATLRPEAEVYAFARRDAVERLLATPREHRGPSWAWRLWRLALCERWLRLQGGKD